MLNKAATAPPPLLPTSSPVYSRLRRRRSVTHGSRSLAVLTIILAQRTPCQQTLFCRSISRSSFSSSSASSPSSSEASSCKITTFKLAHRFKARSIYTKRVNYAIEVQGLNYNGARSFQREPWTALICEFSATRLSFEL